MYVLFVCGGDTEREVSEGVYIMILEVRGHLAGGFSPSTLLRRGPSWFHHAACPGWPPCSPSHLSRGLLAMQMCTTTSAFFATFQDRTHFNGLSWQARLPPEPSSQLPENVYCVYKPYSFSLSILKFIQGCNEHGCANVSDWPTQKLSGQYQEWDGWSHDLSLCSEG